MDQVKIGKFIQQLRKDKGYTQKELADKVGISDKTISKWETGNGMPDIGMLTDLCAILEVNVNELLSGENLPPSEYSKKAEDNIMSLLRENAENKKSSLMQLLVGGLLLAAVCLWMLIGNGVEFECYFDLPSILAYVGLCTAVVLISGAKNKKDILLVLRKISIPVGAVIALVSIIAMMYRLDNPSSVGPILAVAVLGMLYSVMLYFIIVILEFRLKDS